MTPEAPSRNPQTEAGRALFKRDDAHDPICPRWSSPGDYGVQCACSLPDDILAIEAEAAQRVVERIRERVGPVNYPVRTPEHQFFAAILDEVVGITADTVMPSGWTLTATVLGADIAAIGDSAGEEEGQP